MIVGAKGIRLLMLQMHFPIIGMTCSTVRLPNAIMFQYKFTRFHLVLNQDLQDLQDCLISQMISHYCRGELHSPSHDIDTFPYFQNDIM